MKWMKIATVMAAALAFGPAYAFHEGGVAYCDGCHSMHNSSGNATMSNGRAKTLVASTTNASQTQFQGNAYLLQGSDGSSTCLNCHAGADAAPRSYHVMTFGVAGMTAPANRSPGGDFGWLKLTFPGAPYYGRSGTSPASLGERHGHNIVAADFDMVADTKLAVAPGGDYPASALGCASCHDPHSRARIVDANGTIANTALGTSVLPIGTSGSYGNAPDANEAVGVYRLLAPANYSQMSAPGVMAFNANPPVAVAPSSYNRTEATTDTRVAYGKGMSEWCANCHRSIHNNNVLAANTALIHPAGNSALLSAAANDLQGGMTTTIAAIYNAYKVSGDFSGTSATSYSSLVPYEEGTGVIATLAAHAVNDGSVKTGPSTGTENVMCLSCHRAHASGFDAISRWTNKTEFITIGGMYPGVDATNEEARGGQFNSGMTQAQYQAAMYDRPATQFAYAQRSLCNKCHAKD